MRACGVERFDAQVEEETQPEEGLDRGDKGAVCSAK